jgi:hypothetical protein
MRAARWLTFFVFAVAAACGRTANDADHADETTNVAGSESSKQKEPGASGKGSGQGGSPSSSSGTGLGATSSGGHDDVAGAPTLPTDDMTAAGGSCNCDPDITLCLPGYVLSEKPGSCCHCVVDCLSVGCLELDCPAGTHEAQGDDECCPSCVDDQPLSCKEARQKYAELRSELLSDFQSLGCQSDEGCSRFWEDNRCATTCGTPIPTEARVAMEDELEDFAEPTCSNCPQQQPIPCPRPFPSTCVDGICQ